MTKFEEEFNYLIELSGKVLIGQVDAEAFEKNRIAFFEKYETGQQQALPVVKDFVAEWYEEHKDDLDFSVFEACVSLYDDNSNDFKKWFGNSENKSIETLIRMKDGYTVEKPQLFYLKHIDMSKRDKDHDYFAQIRNDRFEHDSVRNNTLPGVEVVGVKFTQQEINSMQTGSYEQIKVEVEK